MRLFMPDRSEKNVDGGADLTRPYFYLAGPMSYCPSFNFHAFFEAAGALRAQGYNIVNPAEFGHEIERELAWSNRDGTPPEESTDDALTWADSLRRDVPIILDPNCKGVFVLPGWWKSKGARLETYIADRLGLPIFAFDVATMTLEQIDRDARIEVANAVH